MKVKYIFLAVIMMLSGIIQAQIYMGKTCNISFFSSGPIEDISANNKTAKPIFNAVTGDVTLKITIKGFEFNKKLMEDDFNKKYLESDKFPYATFTGKVNEPIDYKKEGTYKATITGILNLHGVDKKRTISGTVTVKGGEIFFNSMFNIVLKDHNITIPTMAAQNIAEIVQVLIQSTLVEFQK